MFSRVFVVVIFVFFAIGTIFSDDPAHLTYRIDGEKVTFYFQNGNYHGDKTIESIVVTGTFNNWGNGKEWEMQNNEVSIWTLEKHLSEIAAPGNSGQPEYQFIINGKNRVTPDKVYPDGYKFKNSFVILYNTDNPIDIIEKEKIATTVVSKYKNKNQLSNFRSVKSGMIGNNKLFRSYHPFVASKKEHPKERERVETVRKMIESNKISTVINLSDTPKTALLKISPEYYKNLALQGDIIFAETSYTTVFYKSDSEEFYKLLNNIFCFISKKKPPYLVHCRLGTDRTGVIIAVLEGFMQSSWDEIVADYKLSNDMGIGEYRDEKLLIYSFEKMLGTKISGKTNIKPLIDKMLKEKAGLDEQVLDLVYTNLSK